MSRRQSFDNNEDILNKINLPLHQVVDNLNSLPTRVQRQSFDNNEDSFDKMNLPLQQVLDKEISPSACDKFNELGRASFFELISPPRGVLLLSTTCQKWGICYLTFNIYKIHYLWINLFRIKYFRSETSARNF